MRINPILLLLGTFTFFCLYSCKSTKILGDSQGVMASIERGPCFGKCPVYKMEIYKNGKVMYEGKRFAKKLGKYSKMLTSKELTEIHGVIKSANFFSFDSIYPTELSDLSAVTIYHSDGTNHKSVFGKENRPPALMQIQYALEKIVNSDGWTLLEAAPADANSEEVVPREKEVETTIYSEIIIQPKAGSLAKFLQDFADKSLYLADRITEDGRLWLVKYDTKKYKAEEMLEMIKADARIESAQFNKKLEMRDR